MELFDLPTLIRSIGYAGIFGIVFAESGLLIGFFLPGDSLLFTAGFLASQGWLDLTTLMVICFTGAVIGDSVGYAFGYRFGPQVFKREDSLLFDKRHIQRAEAFYAKHGAKTIVLARFVPFVRTFAPILAGVGKMPYSLFLTYNLLGGALWALGLPYLGFVLGSRIPDIDHYLLPIIVGIVFVSVLPTIIHLARDPAERQRLLRYLMKK